MRGCDYFISTFFIFCFVFRSLFSAKEEVEEDCCF